MMIERYIPQVKEAAVPEDGVWATYLDQPVLFLSIPEWKEIVEKTNKGIKFVWMYDREEDAYLFCFQLSNQQEYAIAFPREHAGMLLQDERSHEEFSILITSEELTDVTEETQLLELKKIFLRRHPKAGW